MFLIRGNLLLNLVSKERFSKSSIVFLQVIKASLGELPFNRGDVDGKKGEEASVPKASEYSAKVRPVVLADGSYATQTAAAETGSVVSTRHITCNLR